MRGAGLDVFEVFRKTMAELGWVMQIFCDWQVMGEAAPTLREIAREVPVIVDHYGMIDAARGVDEPNFQALLKLVGDGHAYVKVSAPYRISNQYPDYRDARPFHAALLRANPERLMWGTDWPHPSIPADVMPDDGHLLDLFMDWTPDEVARKQYFSGDPGEVVRALSRLLAPLTRGRRAHAGRLLPIAGQPPIVGGSRASSSSAGGGDAERSRHLLVQAEFPDRHPDGACGHAVHARLHGWR